MKKILLILIITSFINCNNNEDLNNSKTETDINLVTGINLINNFGIKTGELGNPNELNNNNFVFYPNPTVDVLDLKSLESISKVWITSANSNKEYQHTDFNSILNSNLYSENEIESVSKLKFTELNKSGIKIDLGSLEDGYYRVFVEINGIIYWENIFIGTNNNELGDLLNYWN